MNETIFDSVIPELPTEKAKEPPTESEMKVFKKQFVTRVLPTVKGCEHKVDPELPPRSNCIYCWLTYFNSSAERVETYKAMLSEPNGEQELTNYYGIKYVKNLKRFLTAVENNVESVS